MVKIGDDQVEPPSRQSIKIEVHLLAGHLALGLALGPEGEARKVQEDEVVGTAIAVAVMTPRHATKWLKRYGMRSKG